MNDNERLEYLGDSVLALVVNEYIYKRFYDYPEGSCKIKFQNNLAKIERNKSGQFSYYGQRRGTERWKGQNINSGNSFETLAQLTLLEMLKFILSYLRKEIERIDKGHSDPKTSEYVQKIQGKTCKKVVEKSGIMKRVQ